jgi:hypothetical protein
MFYEKRMGAEIEADHLGDEWKGYILKIAGGNDKQGFPMKQGVLTNSEYCFERPSSVHLREALRLLLASIPIKADTVK